MSIEGDRVKAYQDTIARFEPEIAMTDQDASLTSIAISLKRIADAIEGTGLADKIEQAISSGLWNGAENAIGQWRRSR